MTEGNEAHIFEETVDNDEDDKLFVDLVKALNEINQEICLHLRWYVECL